MRLVEDRDGVLEVRWTWLPFWLSVNPKLKTVVEEELKAGVLMGGVTNSEADMQAMHDHVVGRLQDLFPDMNGLDRYLDAISQVEEPD